MPYRMNVISLCCVILDVYLHMVWQLAWQFIWMCCCHQVDPCSKKHTRMLWTG